MCKQGEHLRVGAGLVQGCPTIPTPHLSAIRITPKRSMEATSPVSNQLSASTQGLSALW